jgi:hypothetical protein
MRAKDVARGRAAMPHREREWRDAEAIDREEASHRRIPTFSGFFLVAGAPIAGLLPAILPLSPGYAPSDTTADIVGAAIASAVAVAIVPLAALAARAWSRHGVTVFGVALFSAGAAAIHFGVAKSHFDEYFLYGLFFVLSGISQLVWAVLVVCRPSRLLLWLGAIGNLAIVAVWAVDRIWGLPIGPDPWTPEPIGFADAAASAFELLLALGCLALLARAARPGGAVGARRRIAYGLTLVVIAVTAMGLLSAIGVGSPVITPSA